MVAPLVELTSELLARASSTSEVLTLNLTNLLILIVLKAIIFGFGLFSVGSSARSSEDRGDSQAQEEETSLEATESEGICKLSKFWWQKVQKLQIGRLTYKKRCGQFKLLQF